MSKINYLKLKLGAALRVNVPDFLRKVELK
jgi:hypothetical protein